MAKILFGIQSFGLGHYTRSIIVIDHLIRAGHEIEVVTADPVYELLRDKYTTHKVARIVFKLLNNRIDYIHTFLSFLAEIPRRCVQGWLRIKKIAAAFQPDIIISDFELYSARVAHRYAIPWISIDNLHVLSHTSAPSSVSKKFALYGHLQRSTVKLLMPQPDACLIPSFFEAMPLDPDRTSIIPPLLREDILHARGRACTGHILVYNSSALHTTKRFLSVFKNIPEQHFIVYGVDQDSREENLILKKYSAGGFIDDLASSRGVITNGGFGLLSEAVYLKKPVLSVPIPGQYEQVLNASYLDQLAYGRFAEKLDPEVIRDFIQHIPDFENSLSHYSRNSNQESLDIIDDTIEKLLRSRAI